jgi:hypothetical protein
MHILPGEFIPFCWFISGVLCCRRTWTHWIISSLPPPDVSSSRPPVGFIPEVAEMTGYLVLRVFGIFGLDIDNIPFFKIIIIIIIIVIGWVPLLFFLRWFCHFYFTILYLSLFSIKCLDHKNGCFFICCFFIYLVRGFSSLYVWPFSDGMFILLEANIPNHLWKPLPHTLIRAVINFDRAFDKQTLPRRSSGATVTADLIRYIMILVKCENITDS